MNSKQRNKNRKTNKELKKLVRKKQIENYICERCGKPGGHWIQVRGRSVEAIINKTDDSIGFYACDNLNAFNV